MKISCVIDALSKVKEMQQELPHCAEHKIFPNFKSDFQYFHLCACRVAVALTRLSCPELPGARASVLLFIHIINVTESLDHGRKRSNDLQNTKNVKTDTINAYVLQKANVNATSSRANVEAARLNPEENNPERERKVENKLTLMLGLNVRLECTATRGQAGSLRFFSVSGIVSSISFCNRLFLSVRVSQTGARRSGLAEAKRLLIGQRHSTFRPPPQNRAFDVSRLHT